VPFMNSIKGETQRWSILGQDQVAFFDDQLKLLLGFRYENLEASSKNFGVQQEPTDDGVTAPRVGVLYQPSRKISFFGVYSGSERPQRATRPDGSLITDPIEGNMFEFGVKASLLNGRLSLQTSYFDIRREHLANGFTRPDGTDTIEPSGLETAKGFEIEIAGYLAEGWQVLLSGGTVDTADHSTFLNYPGSRMGGTMDYTVRLWTNYRFPTGGFKGLEFGGGLIRNAGMYGEDATYVTDMATLVELRAAYSWRRVKLAVNVENVFNQDWWADAPAQNLTLPGTPRRARVTLSYAW
jgi:outer membrane receptor for ferric coprogen and ferric-rhodotorulic acid